MPRQYCNTIPHRNLVNIQPSNVRNRFVFTKTMIKSYPSCR